MEKGFTSRFCQALCVSNICDLVGRCRIDAIPPALLLPSGSAIVVNLLSQHLHALLPLPCTARMACALFAPRTAVLFRPQARASNMRFAHLALLVFVGSLITSSITCTAQDTEDSDNICVQGVSSAKRTLQASQRQTQRVVMSASGQVCGLRRCFGLEQALQG